MKDDVNVAGIVTILGSFPESEVHGLQNAHHALIMGVEREGTPSADVRQGPRLDRKEEIEEIPFQWPLVATSIHQITLTLLI